MHTEYKRKTTAETFLNLDPYKLEKFITGCHTIGQIITDTNPDLLIFPLRGAGPIGWVNEALGHLDQVPQISYVPIGTQTHGLTQKEKACSKDAKQAILSDIIKRTQPTKCAVVEEVQHGGSLVQNVDALLKVLSRKIKLEVIAAVDENFTATDISKRYRKWCQLFAPTLYVDTDPFRMHRVKLPLVAFDKSPLLDKIIVDDSGSVRIEPNHEAKGLFTNIAQQFKRII